MYGTRHRDLAGEEIRVLRRFSFLHKATFGCVAFTLHPRPSRGETKSRSRDAQAAVESDLLILHKEIIKARSIKFQNRSIYMLKIQSNSGFKLSTACINLVQF